MSLFACDLWYRMVSACWGAVYRIVLENFVSYNSPWWDEVLLYARVGITWHCSLVWGLPVMKWEELGKDDCSVARSSVVLGDRWTLVILGHCFLGVTRFDKFQSRLGISRTTLASRLKLLEEHGVLEAVPYHSSPVRYEYRLTRKGLDLFPVISGLVNWGDKYYSGEAGPPVLRKHLPCGHDIQPILCCPECREDVTVENLRARKREDG